MLGSETATLYLSCHALGLLWHRAAASAEAVPRPGQAGSIPYCTSVPALGEVGQ